VIGICSLRKEILNTKNTYNRDGLLWKRRPQLNSGSRHRQSLSLRGGNLLLTKRKGIGGIGAYPATERIPSCDRGGGTLFSKKRGGLLTQGHSSSSGQGELHEGKGHTFQKGIFPQEGSVRPFYGGRRERSGP